MRGRCCNPLAGRRGQSDFGQERQRHRKDRGVSLEHGPPLATCRNPSVRPVDGDDGSAEMERSALPAAFRFEIRDERAIAFLDPPMLALFAAQPFVAERDGAEAARVGRVVAFDRPRDHPPQPIVLPIAKMHLQEFGNRQIGFHCPQGAVKAARMRQR